MRVNCSTFQFYPTRINIFILSDPGSFFEGNHYSHSGYRVYGETAPTCRLSHPGAGLCSRPPRLCIYKSDLGKLCKEVRHLPAHCGSSYIFITHQRVSPKMGRILDYSASAPAVLCPVYDQLPLLLRATVRHNINICEPPHHLAVPPQVFRFAVDGEGCLMPAGVEISGLADLLPIHPWIQFVLSFNPLLPPPRNP